jgi:hypothetical protein
MKSSLSYRLSASRSLCFVAGIFIIPLFRLLFLVIHFYNAPGATEAMIRITGPSPDFREVKEIREGRYFYSLEFSGDIDSFHTFARLIQFPGRLESPTRYFYLTPDSDQRISISFEGDKLLYVSDST